MTDNLEQLISRTALPGDITNLRFVAEHVITRMRRDGHTFPDNIVEMMIVEAREAIKQAITDVAVRERA